MNQQGEYSCLNVEFTVKRVSSKYVCQWLLPTAVLTFISFISFWMKPNKSLRIKFLIITFGLLYLHIIYINNKSTAQGSTATDSWLFTCILFVLSAFVEYGIIKIIEKFNKNKSKVNQLQNERALDIDGYAVQLVLDFVLIETIIKLLINRIQ